MPSPQPYAIHWFRRDLRVQDNPGLHELQQRYPGRVLGFFCFDSQFLQRPDFSHNRFGFFLQTLKNLKHELADVGIDLLVIDAAPSTAMVALSQALATCWGQAPRQLSYGRDYEPFARARDAAVEKALTAIGVEVHSSREHLLVEPWELDKGNAATSSNNFYQIYTPFSRRWLAFMQDQQQRLEPLPIAKASLQLTWPRTEMPAAFADALERFITQNAAKVNVPLPPSGSHAAQARLQEFIADLAEYEQARDFPARQQTSRLSIYFKNGSLSTAQAMRQLQLLHIAQLQQAGSKRYLQELIWREFYYHILYHAPEVEHQAFLPQRRHLEWSNSTVWFERWCQGQTGFPIVDAGMRQLNQTGWMHNRLRMIVASFLTKDLLIDWRWGERYFMQQLLDGDLAANNGGWQWAASTGCDPQPYFRIFNPWLQGKRFDPEATYIKQYVPELGSLSPRQIHAGATQALTDGYPAPVVEHAKQRSLAMALYKVA